MIHTIKGFHVANEVDVDFFFLEFSCFLYDSINFGNLMSSSSSFSKSSLCIWKFSVHVLPKTSLKDFKHIHLQCGRPEFDPWDGKIPWRRERLPTPVFWPGEFHGQYSPWGHKESDTTERLSLTSNIFNSYKYANMTFYSRKIIF